MSAGDDWVDLGGKMSASSGPITDIVIVNKKEKAGEYHLIENSSDGKRANFSEGGFIAKTTRYLCFSRKTGKRGFVLVTDLKVLPIGDRPPLGYMPLSTTMDDNTKSFHTKQLLVKFTPQTEATAAVTDLMVLSVSKKDEVPPGYKRLPEINGFSICFKISPVAKKRSDDKSAESPAQTKPSSTSDRARNTSTLAMKKIKSAVDGLIFKLSDNGNLDESLMKLAIDNLSVLSLQDVEDKFSHDFSKWSDILASSS